MLGFSFLQKLKTRWLFVTSQFQKYIFRDTLKCLATNRGQGWSSQAYYCQKTLIKRILHLTGPLNLAQIKKRKLELKFLDKWLVCLSVCEAKAAAAGRTLLLPQHRLHHSDTPDTNWWTDSFTAGTRDCTLMYLGYRRPFARKTQRRGGSNLMNHCKSTLCPFRCSFTLKSKWHFSFSLSLTCRLFFPFPFTSLYTVLVWHRTRRSGGHIVFFFDTDRNNHK